MPLFSAFFLLIRCLIMPRVALATEILALRQQLIVLNRSVKRPQLRDRDRFFWAMLSKLWKDWREVLIIVKHKLECYFESKGLTGFSTKIRIDSKGLTANIPSRCQTRDRHQMAPTRLSVILAMEVEGSGGPSEDRQGDS